MRKLGWTTSILLVVMALATAVVSWQRRYVLRVQDAVALSVTTTDSSTNTKVIISGGMTHSALTVARTSTQRKGSRLIVRVYVAPIEGSPAVGSYRISADIPRTVNEIWFGDPPGTRTVASVFGVEIRIPAPSDGTNADDGVIWRRGQR
jgi:hypothetical protein